MKNEKWTMFLINVLYSTISVYFSTFFVFYFFKVANYEIIPLVKYYIALYIFTFIGFYLLRHAMKKNFKVPYFRIGIALEALFVSLIMILKDNIINYIYFVAIVKGIAEGFYYFPKNILETEKISNDDRQKYSSILNTTVQIIAIIVPIIMGVLLTFMSYVDLGKIVFILFIVLFIASFFINDNYVIDKKSNLKGFMSLVKNNRNIKYSLVIPILTGLSYSSGVMGLIVTISKINVFQTNLNLGFVDGACALICLITCICFGLVKKDKFKSLAYISGLIGCAILVLYAIHPNTTFLIIYFLINNSFITLLNIITGYTTNNLSNIKEIKTEYKSEYFLVRDFILAVSRCIGFSTILLVSLIAGVSSIYYILIISGIAILINGILVKKIS